MKNEKLIPPKILNFVVGNAEARGVFVFSANTRHCDILSVLPPE